MTGNSPSSPEDIEKAVPNDSNTAALSTADDHDTPNPPYSIFTATQKKSITLQTSTTALFSGLSSFTYYPTIPSLANDLAVPISSINLTISAYLIVAGLSPPIIGDISDTSGRRPVSLLALILCLTANLGLALQDSYAALLALRCLQSAGSAGTIAIAHGVIADITTPAERGAYVGFLFGFTTGAPCVGPILGGVITQQVGWRWVFGGLTIFAGFQLLATLVLFPETERKLVRNGSVRPKYWINRSLWSFYQDYRGRSKRRRNGKEQDSQAQSQVDTARQASTTTTKNWKNFIPNPFSCLSTLRQKATVIIIITGSIQYTIYSVLGTSIATEMAILYDLNPLMTSLLYLPAGIGGVIASLQTGKLLDYNYRVVARNLKSQSPSPSRTPESLTNSTDNSATIPTPELAHEQPQSQPQPQPRPRPQPQPQHASSSPPPDSSLYPDLTNFPIERARLRSIIPFLVLSCLSTLGFGWSLQRKTHIAVPLLMQFLSGSAQVGTFVICATLLTDVNPGLSSTVQAAYSIIRCGFAAAGVAALSPLVDQVGAGWCFTVMAGLSALCAPLLAVLWVWGWGWRREASEKKNKGGGEV